MTSAGETLEDGEVNEDAAPKGLLTRLSCMSAMML